MATVVLENWECPGWCIYHGCLVIFRSRRYVSFAATFTAGYGSTCTVWKPCERDRMRIRNSLGEQILLMAVTAVRTVATRSACVPSDWQVWGSFHPCKAYGKSGNRTRLRRYRHCPIHSISISRISDPVDALNECRNASRHVRKLSSYPTLIHPNLHRSLAIRTLSEEMSCYGWSPAPASNLIVRPLGSALRHTIINDSCF